MTHKQPQQTGFPVETAGVPFTTAPTAEELASLAKIDPDKVRLVEFTGKMR